MCKIADYPGWYSKAKEILRREGIDPTMPGYEFLRRALVIYKVEDKIDKKELFKQIKEGVVVPANKGMQFKEEEAKERDEVEQWIIEAIRSAGIDLPILEYIKQLSDELKM